MIRPTLALFVRTLREDSRGKGSYYMRGALAGVILLFLIETKLSGGWWLGAPGLRFFSEVMFINFFFITLAGLGFFTSAITEEKEEMTLGLLRMTSLNPLAILLGKSTNRLFVALLLLIAQFPFTVLADGLGGVAVSQIVAGYCTLGAYIFALCNVALLASVICRRTAMASVLTGGALLCFFFGPWVIRSMANAVLQARQLPPLSSGPWYLVTGWMIEASPFQRLEEIFGTGFSGPAIGWQVITNLISGIIFFLLAWLAFDVFTRNEVDSAPARGPVGRKAGAWSFLRPGRCWGRAIVWKDFYFLSGGKVGFLAKAIACVGFLGFMIYLSARTDASHEMIGYGSMVFGYLMWTFDLAIAASRIFKHEVKWKTISGFGSMPLSVAEWAWQKALGSFIAALPAFLMMIFGFFLSVARISKEGDSYMFGAMLLLLLDSVCFFLLTAYFSLRLKRGGLPLAIAVHCLGNIFVGGWIGSSGVGGSGFVVVAAACLGFASLCLMAMIGRRLDDLIAAD